MPALLTGTVTFLFTDLETSTRLWDEQPNAMKAALARHDELLRLAVDAYGGRLVKHTGDGAFCVFATAADAVAAAVDAQRALNVEQWGAVGSLRARMGLHSGVAEERDGDFFGAAPNRAARLMAMAHPGQVLCSRTTADLARDSLADGSEFLELGAYQLRGLRRPEVVFQVTHPDLGGNFPPLLGARGVVGNVPRPVTSFVGHERDLAGIRDALENTSVVTLTGVGGVGKTRLALEAATRVAPDYPDGVWWCKLEGVRQSDAVCDAVLDAFSVESPQGTAPEATIVRFLRSKQIMLVLDNCEHLLRPVARLVNEIVEACGDVRILATSREGLGLVGERIFAVASLAVPERQDGAEAIAACDAVRLFVARAQAVRDDFQPNSTNAAAVAQICDRLDGVPLAIELAAARVALLSPVELAERLDQRFRVLTGSERGAVERHQTLRAAIDWSYELLDDAERRFFEGVSVFAAGFTLPAAEAVAVGVGVEPLDVLELLAALVAKSLVVADTQGPSARYRLLETIRQYAEQRLDASGNAVSARDAHARYFAAFSQSVIAGLRSPDASEWLRRSAPESDNIRAALAWAIERRAADVVSRFFAPGLTFGFSDIARVVNAAAESAVKVPGIADDPRFPIMLACAAMHAGGRGDTDTAGRYVDEALAAQQRLGEVMPDVIGARGWHALAEGRVSDYEKFHQESMTLYRETHNDEGLAGALVGSAMAKALKGEDMDAAVAEIDEALALLDRITVPPTRVHVLATSAFVLADVQPERARVLMDDAIRQWNDIPGSANAVHSILGDVAERIGDHQRALDYFVLGLDEHHWLGHTELAGRMLRRIGLALADQDPEDAAMIVGAGMKRSHASTLTERVNRHHRARVAIIEASLGAQRCQALMNAGAAMTDKAAVALAHQAAERALTELGQRS